MVMIRSILKLSPSASCNYTTTTTNSRHRAMWNDAAYHTHACKYVRDDTVCLYLYVKRSKLVKL